MFDHLSNYQHPDPSIWQGRQDTSKPQRFFQKILIPNNTTDLITDKKKTIFLGFASDAGIRRNLGRPGAQLGPNQIRTYLAKLPCSIDKEFIDLGNIICVDDELEKAQDQFAHLIHFCHQQGHQLIAFGGGHEIAWPHYLGLAPHYSKLGIINFDAHFDLRPYKDNQSGNSGTPFSQIAAYCKENNQNFNYCCLGIQKLSNTSSLFARAKELNVAYLTTEEMHTNNLAWQLAFLDDFMLSFDYIYVTLCLDVLAESYAPGVSAPQPLGLTPWQVLPLLKYIAQSGKLVSFDIAELSPPLDQDQKTARLAAVIIAELINTT